MYRHTVKNYNKMLKEKCLQRLVKEWLNYTDMVDIKHSVYENRFLVQYRYPSTI